MIAYSEALGDQDAASLVLAGYAAGSLLVGVVYGLMKLRMPLSQPAPAWRSPSSCSPPSRRFWSDPGAWDSPCSSPGRHLADLHRRLRPDRAAGAGRKLTEGITWGMTGIGLGLALGSIVSGYVIDAFGAQNGFWISVVAGLVALKVVLSGYDTLVVPDTAPRKTAPCSSEYARSRAGSASPSPAA